MYIEKLSQADTALAYMKKHGSVSSMVAYEEFGCTRLAARISDLKERGINIRKTMVKKKRPDGRTICYAEYSLS